MAGVRQRKRELVDGLIAIHQARFAADGLELLREFKSCFAKPTWRSRRTCHPRRSPPIQMRGQTSDMNGNIVVNRGQFMELCDGSRRAPRLESTSKPETWDREG